MSISTRSMALPPGAALRASASIASRPFRAISTLAPFGSSTFDSAKMLRASSSTTSTRRPSSAALAIARHLEHPLPLGRQRRFHLVQEQRHFIQQALRRARVLDDDRLREPAQPLLLVARQRSSGVDDDRRKRHVVLSGHALEQLVAAQIRQRQIHDHAVERRRFQQVQRFGRRLDADDLHVAALQQLRMLSRCRSSSSTTSTRRRPCVNFASSRWNTSTSCFALDRLERVADGAELERLLRVVRHRDDVHRHVAGLADCA